MHACGRLTAPPRECYTLHRKLRLSPSHSTPSPLFPALSPPSSPPPTPLAPSGMSCPHTKTHTHTNTHTILAVSGNLAHAPAPRPPPTPPHTLSGAFLSCIKLEAKVSCKEIFDESWALLHQRHLALTSA